MPKPSVPSVLANGNRRGFVESLRLHVFRDCVAFSFTCNDGGSSDPVRTETVYVPAALAWTLANVLRQFTGNPAESFPSQRIDACGRVSMGDA